jgi:hypothetical protein
MSHWSENARISANGSMGSGAVDAPVKECIDRTWEPLAETEALPLWELQAEIQPDAQASDTAANTSH